MTPRPTQAVVLAAGLGTRLRPLTLARPKPLMPLWNVPLLERIAPVQIVAFGRPGVLGKNLQRIGAALGHVVGQQLDAVDAHQPQ